MFITALVRYLPPRHWYNCLSITYIRYCVSEKTKQSIISTITAASTICDSDCLYSVVFTCPCNTYQNSFYLYMCLHLGPLEKCIWCNFHQQHHTLHSLSPHHYTLEYKHNRFQYKRAGIQTDCVINSKYHVISNMYY